MSILAELVGPKVEEIIRMQADLEWLTTFAVDMRYPISPVLAITTNHARRALDIAPNVKNLCLPKLTHETERPHKTYNNDFGEWGFLDRIMMAES